MAAAAPLLNQSATSFGPALGTQGLNAAAAAAAVAKSSVLSQTPTAQEVQPATHHPNYAAAIAPALGQTYLTTAKSFGDQHHNGSSDPHPCPDHTASLSAVKVPMRHSKNVSQARHLNTASLHSAIPTQIIPMDAEHKTPFTAMAMQLHTIARPKPVPNYPERELTSTNTTPSKYTTPPTDWDAVRGLKRSHRDYAQDELPTVAPYGTQPSKEKRKGTKRAKKQAITPGQSQRVIRSIVLQQGKLRFQDTLAVEEG